MNSWINIPKQSDFSIYNIPFGIGSVNGNTFVCTRIGDQVLNLDQLAATNFFDGLVDDLSVFKQSSLNAFIGLGKPVTNKVRLKIQEALTDGQSPLKDNTKLFTPYQDVQMHVPVSIGDYTDFYSSIEHATNVGKMFRDPENALLPNWRHLPVGYHGRASSIVVSGTPVLRPHGQTKAPDADLPSFGPSKRVDFELEMGFIIGKKTSVGETISTEKAEEHIFGMVLFNDWSARDVQTWEYVPLGPFLSKSFASGISPWVVTLEALDPFRVDGPKQEPAVLPYLQYNGTKNYDIALEVLITPENGSENIVSKSNFKYMYWNMCQQLAHHTCNGCNVNIGDLMASGTISGKDRESLGSMLEITIAGKSPIILNNGENRSFIQDGDTVTIRGRAEKGEMRVGFGEVANTILPARQ